MPDAESTQTLDEAREWLRSRVDDGAECPCCTQLAKVYRRKITSVAARTLIAMRSQGRDWVHVPTLLRDRLPDVAHQGGYATLSQHWGLIEESPDVRDDGARAGWWRVTERGDLFAGDILRIPKYARLYNGRCLGLAGELVGIRDALGVKFDYRELMKAPIPHDAA